MSQTAEAMVLFDIDGTLIRRAGPQHREALVEAVREVTGLETTTDGIAVQGMLDRDIVTEMMNRAGASSETIRQAMPEVIRRAQEIYGRCCPDLRRKVCPGVRMLLNRLERRKIVTGLVTGNLSEIGWKKMEHAGLKPYFRFGAFAEFAGDRAGLVKIAIGKARREGWIAPRTPISLVGDHQNDILAARANGIRSIAVATGISQTSELAALKPDVLLPDLRSLTLKMILSP
jgi:phosphoglycolate phosphatase-like HAD superfamily hydrolase